MTDFSDAESLQTDLFAGTSALEESLKSVGMVAAEELPVAQVLLESEIPHLDRLFDYLVPVELAERAQVGVRVRVAFGEQKLTGYIRARVERSRFTGNMKFLEDVISPVSAVPEELFELAEALADRYANLASNVLRLAVPARVASADKEYADHQIQHQLPEVVSDDDVAGFVHYDGGTEFLADLEVGAATRAVMTVLPADEHGSWEDLFAVAMLRSAAQGFSAIAVVPDVKSVERLERALLKRCNRESFVRLTSHDKPSVRYRSYLRARFGEVSLVIGTRAAAYTPVMNLGLVLCWDDGDVNLLEQRAPYCHARDVLLLRATAHDAAALFASYSLSSEAARLVRSRWATFLSAPRVLVRELTPRVMSTGDDFELARDPLAAVARIPHLAFRAVREALTQGPVLIQVARSGYIPTFSCQRCRMPARCIECRGPLGLGDAATHPACGWCGKLISHWQCSECGYLRWRTASAGALRTAEELGKAFPGVPVVSSSGEHVLSDVSSDSVLIVATPGAEPVAEGGYAAVILLDAEQMIRRDSLRAPEAALRKWLNAASLCRSAKRGGRVIVTSAGSRAVEALIRWDSVRFALWELEERAELQLPPAARTASITGAEHAVSNFIRRLNLPPEVIVRGPVKVGSDWEIAEENSAWQMILFFSYSLGPSVTHELRVTRASAAALKEQVVNIRVDGLDIL